MSADADHKGAEPGAASPELSSAAQPFMGPPPGLGLLLEDVQVPPKEELGDEDEDSFDAEGQISFATPANPRGRAWTEDLNLRSENVDLQTENQRLAMENENMRLQMENEMLRQHCLQVQMMPQFGAPGMMPYAGYPGMPIMPMPGAAQPWAMPQPGQQLSRRQRKAARGEERSTSPPASARPRAMSAMDPPGPPRPRANTEQRQAVQPRRGVEGDGGSATRPHNGICTTVMFRNVPNNYSRTMLLQLLDREGFANQYDFVYLPIDFKSNASLGYAFVNLLTQTEAERMKETFEGFSRWVMPSQKVCSVDWSSPFQGLESHIERFRNSPVMHESVPDEHKPALFQTGRRIPFPAATRKVRAPRVRPGRCHPATGAPNGADQ